MTEAQINEATGLLKARREMRNVADALRDKNSWPFALQQTRGCHDALVSLPLGPELRTVFADGLHTVINQLNDRLRAIGATID
jgi:hypothetical protein